MIRPLCCVLLLIAGGCAYKSVTQLVEEGEETTERKAIRLYTHALANEPSNVLALWRRGNEYAKTNQPEKAIADFTQAIALEPTYNSGYLFGDRGEVLEATNHLPEAIRDYTTALAVCLPTRSPDLPSTPMENFYFYRGRARLKAGDTIAALVDTDSAIYYYHKFPRARFQRARLAVIRGDYDQALADYEVGGLGPYDTQFPDYADDFFYMGLLKFNRQDTSYCTCWAAAARYNHQRAKAYLAKYCNTGGRKGQKKQR
ncbi:tetratricopeptide repeat protein [Hymenobacter yonginensis]|uniref:Tetratricopeptide repeat protein n=1 Tax=Hymenobacter yonginensis TaxID=748197 RepID=A0ABY7PUY2_9BACT|nr:tetratricopeptide repeat protein [Hymenobacter yonginensis]WBO86711.1 tetratricopeptide repeat protein [Hymenobacter yonginensis]